MATWHRLQEWLHPMRQVCFRVVQDEEWTAGGVRPGWYVWTTDSRNPRDPANYRRCRWWRLDDWASRWRQHRYGVWHFGRERGLR